ncbi:MAG: TolC family protein [Gammaproteobacteria bacterium]|nr:TolC family protein [Gammaproteobacteria bacterium]MBU1977737.1 TolC family protein [Gammaproteobacteria bacterium]
MPIWLIVAMLLPGAALAVGPAPALAWLSLSGAEALWAERNRELKLARGAVEGAEADKIGAAQRPNPAFSTQVGAISRNPGIGAGGVRDKMVDTTIGISQLIERGDKREHRMRGAQSLLDATRQDLSDTLRSQRMAMHQAYYDLVLAQEKSRILEESAALYRKSVEASQFRHRAGDIPLSELSRIRVEALRAENEARQAVNDLARAQLSLAYLIGQEAVAGTIRAVDGWMPVTDTVAGIVLDIDRRPDVRAALNRVRAAEAARDLANSLKARDITVGLSFEHNPSGSTWANNSVGVSASVPLFVNYGYEGEIRRAEANLQVARDQLEQVRAMAWVDAARARSDLEAAAQRSKRYEEELLAEAERAARAAEFAYKQGALGLMDLLDARRIYKATLIDAVTASADYAKALASLRAATQENLQ